VKADPKHWSQCFLLYFKRLVPVSYSENVGVFVVPAIFVWREGGGGGLLANSQPIELPLAKQRPNHYLFGRLIDVCLAVLYRSVTPTLRLPLSKQRPANSIWQAHQHQGGLKGGDKIGLSSSV
jgi:hypothetical protein